MTPSPRCAAFIKGFEACRLSAYMPTPRDRPTIGWGATFRPDGKPVRMGDRWTQEQADAAFATSLADFGGKVAKLIGAAPTTQAQYDACVSLAYNIGLGGGSRAGFAQSQVLSLHRLGKFGLAADAFGNWTKQDGTVLRGLVRRRAAEAAMYRSVA